jgi:hypothetical protein
MVAIKIEKSPIPIVWLDTSVITDMTKFKANPEKLEKKQRHRIGCLEFDNIRIVIIMFPMSEGLREL